MTTIAAMRERAREQDASLFSLVIVALTAFLTVVDLFATQAILPALATHYHVAPSAMGVAVNATTLGMAVAGVATALFSQRIPRRLGIMACLALLTIPTLLLASAGDLATFTVLRVAQGVCMAAAFTLTLAYLGEHLSASAAAGAFAAYITGNVASNLVGRLIAAGLVDHFGLAVNFYVFAALNFAGALLVAATIKNARPMAQGETMALSPLATLARHLRNPRLVRGLAIGFTILFAFIGVFTYVNFVLVSPMFGIGMMSLGLVYFVFAPSIATTPLAGRFVARLGDKRAIQLGLSVALLALPLLLVASLPAVLAGMTLVACGTFFAQAVATGFVSRAADADRGAASGLYLASYFLGGLAGAYVLGQAFDRFGWAACVAGVGVALVAGFLIAASIPKPRAA